MYNSIEKGGKMEKRYIILIIAGIIMVGIVIFAIGFGVTYNSVSNNEVIERSNNTNYNDKENNKEDNNKEDNNKEELSNKENKELEYSKVTIGTKTANNIMELIPTVNNIYTIRNINEYKIFTALDNLLKNKKTPIQTINNTLIAYTKEDIIKQAKIMYGEDVKLNFNSEFETPIQKDKDKEIYTIPPYGKVDKDEYIYAYEIKENKDEYLVNIYVIILYYDINSDESKMYINTKESFNSMVNGILNDEKLKEEMELVNQNETGEISLEELVEQFKDKLPKLQYKIIKDSKNENGMYIKEISYVK